MLNKTSILNMLLISGLTLSFNVFSNENKKSSLLDNHTNMQINQSSELFTNSTVKPVKIHTIAYLKKDNQWEEISNSNLNVFKNSFQTLSNVSQAPLIKSKANLIDTNQYSGYTIGTILNYALIEKNEKTFLSFNFSHTYVSKVTTIQVDDQNSDLSIDIPELSNTTIQQNVALDTSNKSNNIFESDNIKIVIHTSQDN